MENHHEKSQFTPLPTVLSGSIERHEHFSSNYISSRHVDVWLPKGYPSHGQYAALYMNDGQMLFDPSITWNKQAWGVAEVVGKLMRTGDIQPCIVVGIWNSGNSRHSDYFPKKPFENLPDVYREYLRKEDERAGGESLFATDIQSDNYLKFITEELKPFIDQRYATRPNAESTLIAGSSMGGLISLYAVCEYPTIFGGAACMSTHWIGIHTHENTPIPDAFMEYLRHHLPDPASHHIYFDYGTEALDALYEPHQLRVDQIMASKGYTQANWQTRKFDGADHSEEAWGRRLHVPLKFLLGKPKT